MSGDRRDDGVAPTLVAGDDTAVGGPDSDPGATLPATSPSAPAGDARLVGHRLGRYEIEYLIGRGGMGEVYAAYDPNLDRPVAVKVLLAGVRGEAHAARLVREAQALARLQHPNVVAVFDAGEDSGHVFLAMQFVEGDTLAAHLRAQSRSWSEVIALFLAAGRGLAAAHAAGIVHRDFKPTNVLVDRTGHVAVTDFGLARQAGDPLDPPLRPSDPLLSSASTTGRRPVRPTHPTATAATTATPVSSTRRSSNPSRDLTRQGELVGTPAYMPGEQIAGGEITAATDQFAFCVALWEALFARHPYAGDSADGSPLAFAAALERGVLHLPERHPVPKRIVAALSRGLAREPAQRWPSMDALLAELARGAKPRHLVAIAACATVVVAGTVVAVVFGLRADPPASCQSIATIRVATVWGPVQAAAITNKFAATGRPYAATAAARARDGLETFAGQWRTASIDACTVSRTGDATARHRADGRLACLDRAHAALAGTVSVLTGDVGGDVVDGVGTAIGRLPPLTDCNTDEAGAPPEKIAAKVSELVGKLEIAETRERLGQAHLASELLAAIGPEVTKLGWAPLQIRFDYATAMTAHDLGANKYVDLLAVAAHAAPLGLHRLELDAACSSMLDVTTADQLDASVKAGQAAAVALGGPEPSLRVSILNGRGLARLRRFREAASQCRDGRNTARDHHWEALEDMATVCLVESLTPLDEYGELEDVAAQALASATAKLGPEHPTVAALLAAQANVLMNQGKHADARVLRERALAIERRAFGEHDIRVADTLRELGECAYAEQDYDSAMQLYNQSLAIIDGVSPPDNNQLWKTHRNLAMMIMEAKHDYEQVRYHFDKAVAAATAQAGSDSIEVAYLLIMYGQYQTEWDRDGGIATLHKAIAIFAAKNDPRLPMMRGALGGILVRLERWGEAIEVLEDSLAHANLRDLSPALIAQMSYQLATALLEVGNRKDARRHAEESMAYYAQANDLSAREQVRDWIKERKLKPLTDADRAALGH